MNENLRTEAFHEVINQYQGSLWCERGRVATLAKSLGITTQAVWQWNKTGIPTSRIPYFKLKFPHLKVWEKFEKKYD